MTLCANYHAILLPYSLNDMPLSRALFRTCPMASNKVAKDAEKQSSVNIFVYNCLYHSQNKMIWVFTQYKKK